MAARSLFLGIDLSTTGAKALVIDDQGQVVASHTTPLTLSTPRQLWVEQDCTEWWHATVASVRAVVSSGGAASQQVAAIGLTGQMHGLVALDAAGEPVRPAILWNDQRTATECDEVRQAIGRERLIQITGNDALAGFTAPKILWVRRHEPDIYARIRHVLLPKDYIRFRLTGEYALDKADGSGTLLFDLARRDWSAEVTDALEIPREWLPPTFEGTAITGRLTTRAAELTGLRPDIPVMAGGGDQSAQAVGVGAVRPGTLALTLGTSGVVFATTTTPLIEPEGILHAFCHAVPDRWHVMGVMLSAAGSLQWLHDAVLPEISFETLLAEADSVPAGSEGLVFLPYLSGERTPHPDPLARAAWVGLTLRHTRAHMARAVLEGVAFGLRDCFELIVKSGTGPVEQVRASGGGARSQLWLQILASVLGVPVFPIVASEGAAYGACLLAGVGAGAWPSVDDAVRLVRMAPPVVPDLNDAAIYNELYLRYRALYPALRPFAS